MFPFTRPHNRETGGRQQQLASLSKQGDELLLCINSVLTYYCYRCYCYEFYLTLLMTVSDNDSFWTYLGKFIKTCNSVKYCHQEERYFNHHFAFLTISEKIERCFLGKKYSMFGLGIVQPLGYSYSADLQTCNIIDLTSRRKVRLRQS